MGQPDGAHTHGGGMTEVVGVLGALAAAAAVIFAAVELIAAIIWIAATIVGVLVAASIAGVIWWIHRNGIPRTLVGVGPLPAGDDRGELPSAQPRRLAAQPATYIGQQNIVNLAGATPEAVAAFVAAQRHAVTPPYANPTDESDRQQ